MTPTVIIYTLAGLLIAICAVLIALGRDRSRLRETVGNLNKELIEVSADASVGRRLSERGSGGIGDLARTINRLFDAIGERDEEIHDKDRLFAEFSKTLPEIVLVHDERILLANESAASLIGLEPEQLVGREAADLVKPAYRALFRKTMAKRLLGESTPERLEIQLISGDDAGMWVEAQSSVIEFRGSQAQI